MKPTDAIAAIDEALGRAAEVLAEFEPGRVEFERKIGGDPVTAADRAVNDALHEVLVRDGVGWLSEETVDDRRRLQASHVWIVDPLDGTREFVAGIPEWCVSVALVENGIPVAGGICNPAAKQTIVGAPGIGVALNGAPTAARTRTDLNGALVLASRSEVNRGEWERFEDAPFIIQPMGSVAYKLALVSAGLADATWTLVPKHEWDVAAGVALLHAQGCTVLTLDGTPPRFNSAIPKLRGLVAATASLAPEVRKTVRRALGGEQNC